MSEEQHNEIGRVDRLEERAEPGRDGGRTCGRALALAFAAVLVIGGGLIAGYVLWQDADAALTEMDRAVERAARQHEALQSRLERLNAELETQRGLVQAHAGRLEEQQALTERYREEMHEVLQSVRRRLGAGDDRWKAAEAGYLLRIARHRVELLRDVPTALAALQAADARLAAAADAAWGPVREAIAADASALRKVDLPDRSALSARISALIEKLRPPGPPAAPPPRPASPAQAPHDRSLGTVLSDGLAGLTTLLEIRRHDRPSTAAFTPEQRRVLLRSLEVQLHSARLALLQAEPERYRAGLDGAQALLAELFPSDDATARAVREEVAELRGVDVRPALPDLSRSVAALREALQEGAGDEVAVP